ncbi:MAG: NMD3-related protein [Candidatus Thorarchaeota archaeon]
MGKQASICISCGSTKIFFSHLCQNCYLENHPILLKKKEMNITVCERCELLFVKGQWSNFYLTDLGKPETNIKLSTLFSQEWDYNYRPKEITIQELNINLDEESYKSTITGVVAISASPDPFVPLMTILEDFTMHIEWGECTECRTRLAGSYMSKIQIRSPREDLTTQQIEIWSNELKRISHSFSSADRKNPLFKINFLKSGIDALFRSKPAANFVGREFTKKFGGIISVTTEFAGFDKSKSKEYPRKQVVLINMPKFDPGKIVLYNHQPIQILNYNSKVEYWDFTKRSKEKIPVKSFLTADLKDLEKEVRHFQLINFEEGGNLAQIMDSQTYEIIFIDSSEISHLSEGATFKGIIYDGKLLRNQKNTD